MKRSKAEKRARSVPDQMAALKKLIAADLAEEIARIEELIAANTWPQGWTGDEVQGNELIEEARPGRVSLPMLEFEA